MKTGLSLKRKVMSTSNSIRVMGKQKYFCIGLNKTGTTSIKKAWEELGIIVGNESQAKNLFDSWVIRDFRPIIKYCKTAQAFQDSPFSFPYTYIALDYAFPNSKFVLTVRDDAEEWYNSLTRFHAKLWGHGSIPNKNDLMNAINSTKGRPWIVNQTLFNTPESEPYKKDVLISFYNRHIFEVKEYFKSRKKDLLVINLKEKDSYFKFCKFFDKAPFGEEFPWENKT